MKKMTCYLNSALLLTCLLSSCCRDFQCPALPEEEERSWLPQATGDQILFEQEGGAATISLQVSHKKASEAYKEESSNSGIGCRTRDCATEGYIRAEAPAGGANSGFVYSINIAGYFNEDKETTRTLRYSLDDFSGGFDLYPLVSVGNTTGNSQMEPDSIVSSLTLAGTTYGHVVIQTRKLPSSGSVPYRIKKVYVAAPYGIVGFVNDQDEKYFRKN